MSENKLAKLQIGGIVEMFRGLSITKTDDCDKIIDSLENILVFTKMWKFLLDTKEYMERWNIEEQRVDVRWLQRKAGCNFKQGKTFIARLVNEGILFPGETDHYAILKLGGVEDGLDEQSSDV